MQFLTDAFNQYGWAGVLVILIGFTWITKLQNDSKVSAMNLRFQDTVNTIAIDERTERLELAHKFSKQQSQLDECERLNNTQQNEIVRLGQDVKTLTAQVNQLRADLIDCLEKAQPAP